MRLLIFAALYYPFEGGYVESIHQLAKKLQENNIDISIITCNTHKTKSEEIMDGIKVYRVPCWNPSFLNNTYPIPNVFSLLKILKNIKKPNFISTQTRFFPTSIVGFIYAKLKNIKILHTERGAYHPESSNFIVSWFGKIVDHTFGRLIFKYADYLICVSAAVAQFCKRLGAKNPLVIHDAVDIDFWKQEKKEQENITLAFVGRVIYGKGVQDLFEATKNINNINIKIIGDGAYLNNLKKLVADLNLSDKVSFLGNKSRHEFKDIICKKNTIFVHPSYSEGFPNAVLEAAAMGLPIIATDVGGTKEILPDEKYGIIVPPKNISILKEKILYLVENKNVREQMGQNAQKYIEENFSWIKISRQYFKLLYE